MTSDVIDRLKRNLADPSYGSATDRLVWNLSLRIHELEAELAFYRGFHDGVCKDGTHVIVPVEQPPIPELPNDMQEFADRHKLGTFIQEVWRQAFRDAHRAMIRAAQTERQQGE